MTCGPSGPPLPCLLVSVGHQSNDGGPPDVPSWQQLWEHALPPGAPTWCPLTPAAALVEDEPRGSTAKRRKIHADQKARQVRERSRHRLFIKLCRLMSTHAVSADRVVNIDDTSCRLLSVYYIGWGRRGVKQAQLQGNTREATTFTFAFKIVHAGKTYFVLPKQPWLEHAHHVTSENSWANTTTLLQLAAT